jgi:hypothetical protein
MSRLILYTCALMILWCVCGFSQEEEPRTPQLGSGIFQDIVRFVAPLIIPKTIQDACLLRDYVRGKEFAVLRTRCGDLYAVDAVFAKARELTWGNTYEALLISFVSTMDHRQIGIQIPAVGSLLWFPLTSEFSDEFGLRVNSLPRRIYPDSPGDTAGDRDKLQHFFGSAFLSYSFESSGSAERVGDAIELGEESFVVDGVSDERDIRANHHGQMFGLTLLRDEDVRPSDFLQLVVAARSSFEQEDEMRSLVSGSPGICIPGSTAQQSYLEER